MASKVNYLTPEGQKNLEEELDQLRSTRRREIAERIHKASETGGTVDNAEYDEAKNEQSFVEGRISDLEQILSGAVVGSAGGHEPGAVDFGSSVTVTSNRGRKQVYTVVGSAEANPLEGKISLESPVGRALMGHKVGDEVEVETPAGGVSITIQKVK